MSRQDTQSAEQRVNQKEASTISALIRCSEVEWSSTFEAHSQRESSTLSENENDHYKFIKLSNSLIFIEINDSIWKTWNIKIADKLDVNANHYSTEKIHIVYVIFRLEDNADQQIYAKHRVDAFILSVTIKATETSERNLRRSEFDLKVSLQIRCSEAAQQVLQLFLFRIH